MSTVPTETSELEFTGNGATVDFPITFPILETSDLKVELTLDGEDTPTLQVEGVDYDVDEAPSDAPVVTMNVAPPADSTLHVERTVPITQETNLRTQGPFSPATLTEMIDKSAMIDQQLHRRLRRVETAGTAGDILAGAGLVFSGVDGNVLDVVPGVGLVVNADEVAVDYGNAGVMAAVTRAAASAGVNPDAARIDHKHDVSTAAAVELTDAANAEGNATTLARSNHTHAHGNRGGGALHAVAVAAGDAGFMSGADKTALDLLTATRSYVQVDNNVAQAIPHNVATTILFALEKFDTLNEYNPATGIFTATKAGYYLASAQVRLTTNGGDFAQTTLELAGPSYNVAHKHGSASVDIEAAPQVTGLFLLAVGETIRVKLTQTNTPAAARNLTSNPTENCFTVARMV